MADFKTVKTFTLLAKIGSGLSLSALFPAAQSSKVATFLKICTTDSVVVTVLGTSHSLYFIRLWELTMCP